MIEASGQQAEVRGPRPEERIANCGFVLRTPTLRAGSQFRIADLETEQEIEILLWERLSSRDPAITMT